MSGEWTGNQPRTTRIRGRRLQAMRARLFARQPWCVLCLRHGRKTRPTTRDHITPIAEGGRDVESNTQAICDDCNRLKTQEERARGVRRSQA